MSRRTRMTPDSIAPDSRDDETVPDDLPASETATVPGSRVKNYDGLIVDPAGNPHTIGADSMGD